MRRIFYHPDLKAWRVIRFLIGALLTDSSAQLFFGLETYFLVVGGVRCRSVIGVSVSISFGAHKAS